MVIYRKSPDPVRSGLFYTFNFKNIFLVIYFTIFFEKVHQIFFFENVTLRLTE